MRRWLDRDRCLRPASIKVLGYFLEHINRRAGYDWHSADTIASDLGLSIGAVEKAFGELIPGAWICLRESELVRGRRKANSALAHDDPRPEGGSDGGERRA